MILFSRMVALIIAGKFCFSKKFFADTIVVVRWSFCYCSVEFHLMGGPNEIVTGQSELNSPDPLCQVQERVSY